MPRNFLVRSREIWEPSNDNHRDPIWPFVFLSAAVVLIVLFGIFFA